LIKLIVSRHCQNIIILVIDFVSLANSGRFFFILMFQFHMLFLLLLSCKRYATNMTL